jgi:hypothetical protein
LHRSGKVFQREYSSPTIIPGAAPLAVTRATVSSGINNKGGFNDHLKP